MADVADQPVQPTGPSKAELLQSHRLKVIDSHFPSVLEDSAVEVCLQVCRHDISALLLASTILFCCDSALCRQFIVTEKTKMWLDM